MITQIPLSSLMPSPDNVRVINAAKAADKELLAGIRAEGLLQNLVVRQSGKKGFYEVSAGGRRYAALKWLADHDELPKDEPINCLIKDNNHTAVSLMENVSRADMHPVDEYKAYKRMVDEDGATVEQVRVAFNKTKKQMNQLLALGRVADVVLKAFASDELDLDDVMAFTVVADKDKQAECYEALKNERVYPHYIKRWLLGEAIRSNSPIAKFVGRSAYKKAGGGISADLFNEVEYFSDSELVNQLALDKLEKAAADLKNDGWKWVEICTSGNIWGEYKLDHQMDESYSADAPAESIAKVKELNAQIEEMEGDYDWDEVLQERFEKVEAERESLEAELKPYMGYTAEQKSIAGCFIGYGSGELTVNAGYVLRSDARQMKAENETDSNCADADSTDGEVEISQALNADLGAHRQQAAQATMAKNPKLAMDLLHYTLCMQIIRSYSYSGRDLLNCHFSIQESVSSKDDLAGSKSATDLLATYEGLQTDWATVEDDTERFQAFCELPKKAKESLVAYCVGRTLKVYSRPARTGIDAIIDELAPPFSEYWRPTKENYFGRLTAPLLLKQMSEVRGTAWAEVFKDKPKKAIVTDLEDWFYEDVDDERKTWVPPQF